MNEETHDYRDVTDEFGNRQIEEHHHREEKLPGMERSFWSRNGATIITLVILGLIIGGAIAVNERRTDDDDLGNEVVVDDNEPSDQTPDFTVGGEIGSGTSTPTDDGTVSGDSTSTVPSSGIRITETEENGKLVATSFEVTAQPGEGRTHLARRAITEQIRRTNADLSPEQRVYAEDYLQKLYAPKVQLHPGSTITFTADQVNEAVSASQSLNSAQLQNLHQYSVLVSWPPI